MMWTTQTLIAATDGKRICGDPEAEFSGISIDSRAIGSNDVFVAIIGEIHDGHTFIPDVLKKQVRGLIIDIKQAKMLYSEEWEKTGVVCIGVKDTTVALGDLASYVRTHSTASVVAITGSNGKTTTRGMVSAIVAPKYESLSTKGNFNNRIGLPLTLLELAPAHQWVVLELGMNRPGEISALGNICHPDIGVITNVAPAHLEGFDSIDGVAKAKAELLETISGKGTLILNGDDPRVRALSQYTGLEILLFGQGTDAHIRADHVTATATGHRFDLVLPMESIPVELNFPGRFMVSNALAAAAVGYRIGLSGNEIKRGLESFAPETGRMNVHHTPLGIHLIDDTYNANPVSMEGAIRTLRDLKKDHRGILVAGDMLELGTYSESLHQHIGSLIAASDIAGLYVTGSFADTIAQGARDKGMDREKIHIGDQDALFKELIGDLKPGDWVLLKGSRKMALDRLFHRLKKWADDPQQGE